MQATPEDATSDKEKFNLNDAMMDVLVHNKYEFVLLFLECGIKLKNFIRSRLFQLYDEVCITANNLCTRERGGATTASVIVPLILTLLMAAHA